MTEKKLLKLKEQINLSKTKSAQLTGSRVTLLKTLKKKFKCNTLKQAEMVQRKMKKEVVDLEKKKELGIKKLEKDYDLS